MKQTASRILVVAAFALWPSFLSAQFCFDCGGLINPCDGVNSGWDTCSQPDPDSCNLHGAGCGGGFAAAELAPSGSLWVSGDKVALVRETAQHMAITLGSASVESCRGFAMAIWLPPEDVNALRAKSEKLVL